MNHDRVSKRVDQVCDAFEQDWRDGKRPPIEPVVRAAPEAEREQLAYELVALDRHYRSSNGETPTPEEYLARLPAWPAAIHQAFGAHPSAAGQSMTSPLSPDQADATDWPVTQPIQPGEWARRVQARENRFTVLRELGQGGMGKVWLARDNRLGRLVALKRMRSDLEDHPALRDRFGREARAAAAIKHENVVTVYEVGEEGGTPYLVMEYVEGQSLSERLSAQTILPMKEALRIGWEIADALEAAHAQGVVHRDVKPSNVLLEGEKARVKVVDFGLAKYVDAQTQATDAGTILGTLPYLAPEQLDGKSSPACDLHSLGCVLYRMVTGRMAFVGETQAALIKAKVQDTPARPREINPAVPPALDDLIMKLLEKEPSKRPLSAAEVASALRLVQMPPSPPPVPWWRRLFAACCALLLTAAVAGVVIVIRHKDGKETEVEVERGSKVKLEKGKVIVTPPDVSQAPSDDKGKAAKDKGRIASPREAERLPEPMTEGESVLDRLDAAKIPAIEKQDWHPRELVAVFGKHQDKPNVGVTSISFTARGTHFITGSEDGAARLWGVARGESDGSIVWARDRLTFASLFPGAPRALVVGLHQPVRVFESGMLRTPPTGSTSSAAVKGLEGEQQVILGPPVFTRDGKEVFLVHRDRDGGSATVRRWDVTEWREVKAYRHPECVVGLALSPDGQRFVTVCNDGTLRLWKVSSDKEVARFTLPKAYRPAPGVAWSPDLQFVAAGLAPFSRHPDFKKDMRAAVKLWDVSGDTPKEKSTFTEVTGTPLALAWSPNGDTLASTDDSGLLVVQEAESGVVRMKCQMPKESIRSLAFAHDSRHLAVGTRFGTVLILRLPKK